VFEALHFSIILSNAFEGIANKLLSPILRDEARIQLGIFGKTLFLLNSQLYYDVW
jgi:hypothetical protein